MVQDTKSQVAEPEYALLIDNDDRPRSAHDPRWDPTPEDEAWMEKVSKAHGEELERLLAEA